METRRRRLGSDLARSRHMISVLAIAALVGTAACGTSSPSGAVPSGPPASAAPPSSAAAQPTPAAVAGGDWAGFRGDPSRMATGLLGPIGNPVLNWRFK